MITYGRCYASAVELSVQLLQGKWKASILHCLGANASLRYGDIRRALPGLTDKVLTRRLRDLEDAELVERIVHPKCRVEYALSPLGRSLAPIMESLDAWGIEQGRTIKARFVASPGLDGERPYGPCRLQSSRSGPVGTATGSAGHRSSPARSVDQTTGQGAP